MALSKLPNHQCYDVAIVVDAAAVNIQSHPCRFDLAGYSVSSFVYPQVGSDVRLGEYDFTQDKSFAKLGLNCFVVLRNVHHCGRN